MKNFRFNIYICILGCCAIACQRKFVTLVANQKLGLPIYLNDNAPYFLSDIDSLDTAAPVSAMVMESGRPRPRPTNTSMDSTQTEPKAEPMKQPDQDSSKSNLVAAPIIEPAKSSESSPPLTTASSLQNDATQPPQPIEEKSTQQSADLKTITSDNSIESTSSVSSNNVSANPPLSNDGPLRKESKKPGTSNELLLPLILEEEIFEIKANPSEKTTVHDNIIYPKNSVFSIQIGAFVNPISDEFYQNFSPVISEKLNDNLKRYTVGLFVTQTQARSALRKIRSMGYQDAFIVVHDNGNRMTLQQWKNR